MLRDRASKNFERHLDEFLTQGKQTGLPANRMSATEWQRLNDELASKNVVLVPGYKNGIEYYWYTNLLGRKIHPDFDKYVSDFLQTGKNRGFPAMLMTNQEWEKLNEDLAQKNIVLISFGHDGYEYYKFAKLENERPVEKTSISLHSKVHKDFDKYMEDFLQTGKNRGFPVVLMTDQEWEKLNEDLKSKNVKLVLTEINGQKYYKFVKLENAAVNSGKERPKEQPKITEPSRPVLPGFKRFGNQGIMVSNETFDTWNASVKLAELKQQGYVGSWFTTKGSKHKERYVIVVISKEDAVKNFNYQEGKELVKEIDNSAVKKNYEALRKQDFEITKIGNMPVYLEDLGSFFGRAMATVRIGNKKIPFYVSTGKAGKTEVPTGKWEVFWGIGDDGWLNKGTKAEILDHYGSAELRKIAQALDSKLGDPRNIEYVLETAVRLSQGGKGAVADANLRHISEDVINSGLMYHPDEFDDPGINKAKNIKDVTEYLRQLSMEKEKQNVVASSGAKPVLTGFKWFGNEGVMVSNETFDSYVANNRLEQLKAKGYVVERVPTMGVGGNAEKYLIVAISKEDAVKNFNYDGRKLVKKVDNTAFLKNWGALRQQGFEITRIGNMPVYLYNLGTYGGRSVATVGVGDVFMPFYVSSGAAGKTEVPTGKWEVFWGIGDDDWFNKGGYEEILDHYGSAELRKIAQALDSKLGDPRNIEYVLETAGRQSFGGTGIVAEADLNNELSKETINRGLRYRPVMAGWDDSRLKANVNYVTDCLRQFSRGDNIRPREEVQNKTPNFNQGKATAKKKFTDRFFEFFGRDGTQNS